MSARAERDPPGLQGRLLYSPDKSAPAMLEIPRPTADEYAPFYEKYVARVPDSNLIALLESQKRETTALCRDLTDEQAQHRYAPGKWSVQEVLGHMADAERVFAYRILRIARGDTTPLPGFDENAYVAAADCARRALADVLEEYQTVRRATITLLHGLPPDAWARMGTASNAPVSVRALAYLIAGHERHHVHILRERYGLGEPVSVL